MVVLAVALPLDGSGDVGKNRLALDRTVDGSNIIIPFLCLLLFVLL